MLNSSDYPTACVVRSFDIEAVSLPIVYNKFGDHDKDGLIYVLAEDSERIRRKAEENFCFPRPSHMKRFSLL